MHMLLRTLLIQLTWRFRTRLAPEDVARLPMRVMPIDLDVLRHVNNGVYLSLMDLGRWDLLLRSGVWQRMRRLGLYPVVASSQIAYRKSLEPGQRYVLESRIVGYDDRSVYLEQRFVVRGEVYVRAIVRGRFLQRGRGVLPMAEVGERIGVDTSRLPVSAELAAWAADVALPSTRAAAPSAWD